MLRSVALVVLLVGCSSDYASANNEARKATAPTEPTTQSGKTAVAASSTSTLPQITTPATPTADAAAPEAPGCKLDTRTVYVQGGIKIESMTAKGRYIHHQIDIDGAFVSNGSEDDVDLGAEAKFGSGNGPCVGHSPCVLDTRTVYFDDGTKVETITAYGSYFVWSFDANNQLVPNDAFPQKLEQTDAFRDGPCAFANGAACVFDTRALEMTSSGKQEHITAYGRSFSYAFVNGARVALPGNGAPIETIARFGAGPCKGQPANACVLDTLTRYVDLDGARVEEVTARGRLWAYRLSSSGDVLSITQDGVALDTIPRLAAICQK